MLEQNRSISNQEQSSCAMATPMFVTTGAVKPTITIFFCHGRSVALLSTLWKHPQA
jgi:hypothetical protein